MTKVYTVAHVPPELEREWLQHLRDFDTAHPGCHFEVVADAPGATFAAIVDTLRVNPGLPLMGIVERNTRAAADIVKGVIALLPDDRTEGLRVLDAARRMVERFKRETTRPQ